MDATAGPYDPSSGADVLRSARTNIERLRQREVTLRLVDSTGRAIANTAVEVIQTHHAFAFGDHLWDLDRYFRYGQEALDTATTWKRRFTQALTAANALCYWTERPRNDGPKTEDVQGDNRLDGFAHCVDWATTEGLIVKGHPLVWSIPKAVPEWVMRYDVATQMKFLEVRVRGIVARFKGRVKIWDAVNEPTWEPAWPNLARRDWPHLDPIEQIADYIEPVLRWCGEEDPDATFLINEYGMEVDPPNGPPIARDGTRATAALQRRRMIELVGALRDRGQEPGGIGMQSHTGGWIDPVRQWAVYDELSTTGLPLHITEFWADTHHLTGKLPQAEIDRLQGDYVEKFLTCAFGHPAIGSFFFWGFMQSAIRWQQHSAHDVAPLFERVADLIHRQWKTHLTLRTNADGLATFRGFFGDYSVRLPLGSGTQTGHVFSVSPQPAMPLTIRINRMPER